MGLVRVVNTPNDTFAFSSDDKLNDDDDYNDKDNDDDGWAIVWRERRSRTEMDCVAVEA